jgi:hypothetical protein
MCEIIRDKDNAQIRWYTISSTLFLSDKMPLKNLINIILECIRTHYRFLVNIHDYLKECYDVVCPMIMEHGSFLKPNVTFAYRT